MNLHERSVLLTVTSALLLLIAGAAPYEVLASRAPPGFETPASTMARDPFLRQPRGESPFFVENVGQFPRDVRFLMHGAAGGRGRVWLAKDALWLTTEQGGQGANLKLRFAGAMPNPRLEPFGRREAVVNYYHGSDPAGWYAHVPVWSGVRYVDLYPGVDLEITAEDGRWAWQLDAQHAIRNTSDVYLRVEGAEMAVLEDNALRLTTAVGNLTLPLLKVEGAAPDGQPTVFNITPGVFEVTSPFASRLTSHVSGPVLYPQSTGLPVSQSTSFSADNPDHLLLGTFLGGDNNEEANALAVGGDGTIYLTGFTQTPAFTTTVGAYDTTFDGEEEIFVTRLNAAGDALVYSTFLGGGTVDWDGLGEEGLDLAVEGDGTANLLGWTMADDYPTTEGAFDPDYNAYRPDPRFNPAANFVISQLDGSGALAYSTYLGFQSGPTGGIAVDGKGQIYVTGHAGYSQVGDSIDPIPTTSGAYATAPSDTDYSDTFVVKLDPAGQGQADLRYGTYVGASGNNVALDLTIDNSGIVYVTGYTEAEFPTTEGAYDRAFGGQPCTDPGLCDWDTFFYKLDPAGNGTSDLLYATHLGGEEGTAERGTGIAVDGAGLVYLVGETDQETFPTTEGAYDTELDGFFDNYVALFDPAGQGTDDLLYATLLGGGGFDYASDIVVFGGGVHVTGSTYSSNFPTTPDAYQGAEYGYSDIFVTYLKPRGGGQADLIYSTYLGGYEVDSTNRVDGGSGIVAGTDGSVYVAGYTASSDFPTTSGAYDTTFGGGECSGFPCDDAFVARLKYVDLKMVYLPLVIR